MKLEAKKAKDLFEDRIFTISNFLSIFRVLLLPFFFLSTKAYAEDAYNLSALFASILYALLAVISDYLDGLFARLLNQETSLGRYLDPVCDKIVTLGGLLVTTLYFQFPAWILFLYFIREVMGVWLGGFLYLKRGLQGKPNAWGKLGVGLVALSVVWHISVPYFKTLNTPYPILLQPIWSAYLMLTVLVVGVLAYAARYWKIIFSPEEMEIDPSNHKQAKKYLKL